MNALPIQSLPIITPVATSSQDALEAALDRHGFQVFHIDGREVTDAHSFLARASEGLPLPAGVTPKRWSSLTDALWQGMFDVAGSSVAIVWTRADRMLEGGLSDLLLAADCFTELARKVYDGPSTGLGREIVLKVFLLGDGPNFPTLSLT